MASPRNTILADLQSRLEVSFADASLLDLATTHRSWAYEHVKSDGTAPHNERLEFLGDAVLGIVITERIYTQFPDREEGDLARLRSALVRASTLAEAAREVDLGAALRLGRGEKASGGADKESILADSFEAVIGAVHLDGGAATSREFVERIFTPRIDELSDPAAVHDPKTALQERLATDGVMPEYDVTSVGPDHDKTFEATVMAGLDMLGSGEGKSKKEAEQAAAGAALDVLDAK